MSNLVQFKEHKKGVIKSHFKEELDTITIDITLPTASLVVGTVNDKDAYIDVWFGLTNEADTDYIKDRNGKMVLLSKTDIKTVISLMVEAGKILWAKKEQLFKNIDQATTIEQVEAIKW